MMEYAEGEILKPMADASVADTLAADASVAEVEPIVADDFSADDDDLEADDDDLVTRSTHPSGVPYPTTQEPDEHGLYEHYSITVDKGQSMMRLDK